MRVGVPKEIKNHEYRVGLTPASVAELTAAGHELFVETKAGGGIDCPDPAFRKAGATIRVTGRDWKSSSRRGRIRRDMRRSGWRSRRWPTRPIASAPRA